ncbi:MAG: hypothetical protein JSW37_11425, partial [Anaerolineales bacterium]
YWDWGSDGVGHAVRVVHEAAVIHSVHHRGELSVVCTGLGYPLSTMDIILHFINQSGQSSPFG